MTDATSDKQVDAPGALDDAAVEPATYPAQKTLRDEFAMAALAIFPHAQWQQPLTLGEMPKLAYDFAAAMMEARKQ